MNNPPFPYTHHSINETRTAHRSLCSAAADYEWLH